MGWEAREGEERKLWMWIKQSREEEQMCKGTDAIFVLHWRRVVEQIGDEVFSCLHELQLSFEKTNTNNSSYFYVPLNKMYIEVFIYIYIKAG